MTSLETRQKERDSLLLMAALRVGGNGHGYPIKVRNLSAGGMMAEGEAKATRGALVMVELRNIGWVEGSVAWKQDNRFGIAFVDEIDPTVVDQWGIPVLRFHGEWSDHEHLQVKHMQETFRALVAEMGGEVFSPMPTRENGYGIATGGRIIHELGCVRMGDDPKTSALNANCQAHDCRNLFVADGGPFVSQADKNPTWTILALAWRTSDGITRMMKGGEL